MHHNLFARRVRHPLCHFLFLTLQMRPFWCPPPCPVLLGGYSFILGGGWLSLLALFSGSVNTPGFDGSLVLFSIVMLIVTFCCNQIAKELLEHPTHPLHTMARGNSYLMRFCKRLPPLHGIWWHFTTQQVIWPRVFPLGERAVQTLAEPLLLVFLKMLLFFTSSNALGFWLMLSGLALRLVEFSYYPLSFWSCLISSRFARVKQRTGCTYLTRFRSLRVPACPLTALNKSFPLSNSLTCLPYRRLSTEPSKKTPPL